MVEVTAREVGIENVLHDTDDSWGVTAYTRVLQDRKTGERFRTLPGTPIFLSWFLIVFVNKQKIKMSILYRNGYFQGWDAEI